MARVLLLLARTSYRAGAFIDAATRLGIDVAVASNHRQVVAELAPGAALTVELADSARSLDRILEFARLHPPDAVIAAEDDGAVLAARAAAALGLPHNPPDAVRAARYKHLARDRMVDAGIPVPEYQVLSADADPTTVAQRVPYPCVIKPVGLAASRGVIRADSPDEFVRAFRLVASLVEDIADEEAAGTMIVEGYVPGTEVAVEALLTDGRLDTLAIFDKPDPLVGPYFEETIYLTPTRLPADVQAAVTETTSRSAAALGLRHGPVHAELRCNDAGVWPIELAPRSIGGLCSRVLRFRDDTCLEELILLHALGRETPDRRTAWPASGVMMLPIPAAGVLGAVHGLDAARGVPGIEDIVITATLGQEIRPLPEGSRYLGFAFARGGDPAFVEAALRTAERLLDYEIDETAGADGSG